MENYYTPELFMTISDEWNGLLGADASLEETRVKLLHLINHRHFYSYSDRDNDFHDLDLVVIRDCARVWRGLLHPRSERLAGFSVLEQLVNAVKGSPDRSLSAAFWAEVYHLVRGIEGKFRFHERALFSFSDTAELKGRDAALVRSSELDLMHKHLSDRMQQYRSGLKPEVEHSRDQRIRRILNAAGGSGPDWSDWHWHLRNIARDGSTLSGYTDLSDVELDNINRTCAAGIPFGVTPYYASLFQSPESGEDAAIRAQVLFPGSYIDSCASSRNGYAEDFMLEGDTSPEDLITRRYPGIVILKPYNSCPQICVYCQRNWEIKGPLEEGSMAAGEQVSAAIDWIREHDAITEVLITGGDPLVMSDSMIEKILVQVSGIPHVERIRIGTRAPVTLPMRFTDGLCDMLASFRSPGRREIALMTHIQHPLEVTPDLCAAVEKVKSRGISVYNQLVFTFFISRRFEAARLRRLIRLCGVDPYYSFYPKGKLETADYRVPIARMLQEQKEESRLMPGLVRTDEPVYNVPGLGKNNLNAWQNRDFISIRSNGARVFEFHPWEKKIADQRTYVGEDVPLLDYLSRLEKSGEDVSDYKSIWYYF